MSGRGKSVAAKPVAAKPVAAKPVVEPCAIDKDGLNQMVAEIQLTIDAYASLLSSNFQSLQPFLKNLHDMKDPNNTLTDGNENSNNTLPDGIKDSNNTLINKNKNYIIGLITDVESLNSGLFALQERLKTINGLTPENTYDTEKLQEDVDDFLSKNKKKFNETLEDNLYNVDLDLDLDEGQGGGRKSRKTRKQRKSRKQRKTRR